VKLGSRMGIIATLPTSPPATCRQLERAAREASVSIDIKIVVNETAFEHLQKGEIEQHNTLVKGEMDRLAKEVDVLVLGQISLAQIQHETRVPYLQVGHSGLAEARRLLDGGTLHKNGNGNGNGQPRREETPTRMAARVSC